MASVMKKTTVLLDAGGVLLDEAELEEYVCDLVTDLVSPHCSPYTRDDYWSDTREAILRLCPRTPQYVLRKRTGSDKALYSELWSEYTDRMKQRPGLRLYAEVAEEVPALAKAYKLVLAGQYGSNVYELLGEHGLAQYFANRLSQADFDITKPDPRYIAQIAERAGVAPAECIVVGDRIDKDVIPAKQNNMGTVFVRTGIYRIQEPRIPDEVPDITLDGLSGLADKVIGRWHHQPERCC